MELNNTAGSGSNVTEQNSTCDITQEEWRDAIVIVRLVFSGLSMVGSLSIIITVLATRTFKKQTIHPLLALSIADLIFSLLFVVGGAMWLSRVPMNSIWIQTCFIISRLTLITALATLCLQLVYGTLAYLYIKKIAEGIKSQPLIRNSVKPTVSCGKVSIAYLLAWAIPTIMVAIPYISLAVDNTKRYGSTSCWCLPSPSNVIPYTFDTSKEAQEYLEYLNVLHLSTVIPLLVLTSIIIAAMISIYLRMWCFIKRKTNDVAVLGPTARNQELQIFITDQRKSFKRIIVFMTYFIFLTVFILATLVYFVAKNSRDIADSSTDDEQKLFDTLTKVFFLIYAVVIPVQGAVNAVIFGWSRPTFFSGLSRRLRRPPPITLAPQRQVSMRGDFSPVSSGNYS